MTRRPALAVHRSASGRSPDTVTSGRSGRCSGWCIVLGAQTVAVMLGSPGSAEMAERIETLETSRAGAVDVQDSELRRIERDLHDGAQARLVALGMSLGHGRAEAGRGPRQGRGAAGRGPGRRRAGAARAARPRPRDPSAGTGRPRAGGGAHRAGQRHPDARHAVGRRPPASGVVGGERGLLRGRRGARQRGQARPRRLARHPDRARRAPTSSSRSATTASAAPTRTARGWWGFAAGSRRSTARSRSPARPAVPTTVYAELPCG